MSHVELNIKDNGLGSIVVDGVDWSNAVSGVDFSSQVGDINQVTLHLAAPSVTGDWDANLVLPAAVQEVLMTLGWTPPKG